MKRHFVEVVLLALAVVSLVGLGFSQENVGGQRGAGPAIIFNAPFPFMINETMLPAGKYQVYREDQWQFSLRSDGSPMVRVDFYADPQSLVQQPVKGRVLFDVIGDKYYLASFWYAGEAYGYYIPKTRSELKMWKMGKVQTKELPIEPMK
jgi:hypothetical protein